MARRKLVARVKVASCKSALTKTLKGRGSLSKENIRFKPHNTPAGRGSSYILPLNDATSKTGKSEP